MIYIEALIGADALTQEESTRKRWSQYFVSAMQCEASGCRRCSKARA
jgi:hypothetical protein